MGLRLSGTLGWSLMLGLVVFTPVIAMVVGAVSLLWLVKGFEGLIIGLLMWNVMEHARGALPKLARVWQAPNVKTLGAAVLIGLVWWDPGDYVAQLAHSLAGGGFLAQDWFGSPGGSLGRLFRGTITLGGIVLLFQSVRPTQAKMLRAHGRDLRRSKKERASEDDVAD